MSTDRPKNAVAADCVEYSDHPVLLEVVRWIPCAQQMPDDDRTVLIYRPGADDEPVWLGYHSGDEWITIDGSVMESMFWPTHWADMPEGPTCRAA